MIGIRPPGGNDVLTILLFSFPLLFIQFELAICSLAPRSTIVSCLPLQKMQKYKIKKGREALEIIWEPQGILVQKAKSYRFETHGGTSQSSLWKNFNKSVCVVMAP